MATEARGWIGRMGVLGTSVLAVIILVTPLALWVSWTGSMFVGVIVLGVTAAALYCLLDRTGTPRGRDQAASPRTVDRLDEQTVEELSNLQPFVYHNRLSVERHLRNTLDKVKETLRGKQ